MKCLGIDTSHFFLICKKKGEKETIQAFEFFFSFLWLASNEQKWLHHVFQHCNTQSKICCMSIPVKFVLQKRNKFIYFKIDVKLASYTCIKWRKMRITYLHKRNFYSIVTKMSFYKQFQFIVSLAWSFKYSFAFLKCPQSKNPLWAESGEGWTLFKTKCFYLKIISLMHNVCKINLQIC